MSPAEVVKRIRYKFIKSLDERKVTGSLQIKLLFDNAVDEVFDEIFKHEGTVFGEEPPAHEKEKG